MEKLSFSKFSSSPSSAVPPPFVVSPYLSLCKARRRVSFTLSNPKKFSVFASKSGPNDDDKLNQWDLMELKFGQMLGEDPKLTLAKIMGRKANPDASYIDIEKNFYKNIGKLVEVKELPFDVPEKQGSTKMGNGLNLVKPVPKKGIKVGGGGGEENSKLPEIKRPNELFRNKVSGATKSNVPNVILRKPSVFDEKDDEMNNSSRLKIKPNLSLSMRTEPVKEQFSGMTLLKKPQVSVEKENSDQNKNTLMDGSMGSGLVNKPANTFHSDSSSDEATLLEKPMPQNTEGIENNFLVNEMDNMMEDYIEGSLESEGDLVLEQDGRGEILVTEMQLSEQTGASDTGNENGLNESSNARETASEFSVESVLLGKPRRLDPSVKEVSSYTTKERTTSAYPVSFKDGGVQEQPHSQPLKESEETAWTQVEKLFNVGDRVEVELISCSTRGFVVSFRSLIGFLPYRNLAAKWKFLAFESWLRKNGLDPSKYRQHLGIIGNEEVSSKTTSLESSPVLDDGVEEKSEISADMELEGLLKIYDQEKIQYLSSYVGQLIRVNIFLADKKSRKLIFSMRPKEKEESIERKRSLMAKLSVGDVVKCCIKKITYFGIFVEVEGVPALIHQTEVSWDGTLDPSSYLKIGQIVEAKVHQLDFALERIFLSLKEITPDPLNEALECIVGSNGCSGTSNVAQEDTEWAEVDSLVEELQAIDGVETVTKGRFFLSPGLAPTFQVYMASMFENQYKLLARSGNKVQELMVEASLDKEDMKSVILKCTNRVDI
ncbi:uncharacterized protein LOC130804829 [Amaranthus tricolor]|uniref:uncharacterized protein LOC130804829 n=1 Tax=Amaranthus tricolor TaxID=29722 RepID=UPI00258B2C84|nr:uncharacterized protein LOC130804829 [Amaranthus tricolor]